MYPARMGIMRWTSEHVCYFSVGPVPRQISIKECSRQTEEEKKRVAFPALFAVAVTPVLTSLYSTPSFTPQEQASVIQARHRNMPKKDAQITLGRQRYGTGERLVQAQRPHTGRRDAHCRGCPYHEGLSSSEGRHKRVHGCRVTKTSYRTCGDFLKQASKRVHRRRCARRAPGRPRQ